MAKKQLLKLTKDVQKRIISALGRIRIRPEFYITKIVGESVYKFRVGDYRILMDVQHEKLLILVVKVGHRKNVYDF